MREKNIEINEEIRQDYKTTATPTTILSETNTELAQSSTEEVASSSAIRSTNGDASTDFISNAISGSPLKLFVSKDS